MVIRSEQIREFELVGTRRLVEALTSQVRKVWHEECARVGDAAVPEMVQTGVERALAKEFVTDYDVSRYVNLVFAFENPDFVSEPWAAEIIDDTSILGRIRMNLLWEAARQRLV